MESILNYVDNYSFHNSLIYLINNLDAKSNRKDFFLKIIKKHIPLGLRIIDSFFEVTEDYEKYIDNEIDFQFDNINFERKYKNNRQLLYIACLEKNEIEKAEKIYLKEKENKIQLNFNNQIVFEPRFFCFSNLLFEKNLSEKWYFKHLELMVKHKDYDMFEEALLLYNDNLFPGRTWVEYFFATYNNFLVSDFEDFNSLSKKSFSNIDSLSLFKGDFFVFSFCKFHQLLNANFITKSFIKYILDKTHESQTYALPLLKTIKLSNLSEEEYIEYCDIFRKSFYIEVDSQFNIDSNGFVLDSLNEYDFYLLNQSFIGKTSYSITIKLLELACLLIDLKMIPRFNDYNTCVLLNHFQNLDFANNDLKDKIKNTLYDLDIFEKNFFNRNLQVKSHDFNRPLLFVFSDEQERYLIDLFDKLDEFITDLLYDSFAKKDELISYETFSYDTKYYKVFDGTFCDYHGKEEEIVLDKTITSIGAESFKSGYIKKLILTNVSYIGERALKGSNIVDVELNNGIQIFGEKAFEESSITRISIPNSVYKIGKECFANCNDLVSVTLPDKLNIIEKGMFAFCNNLPTISIPSNIEYIGEGAFSNCSHLKSITLSNKIHFISSKLFFQCKELDSIIIPNGVTKIGDMAFFGCCNLKTIILPNDLECIGAGAFQGCSALENIILPESVLEIGDGAFANCINLQSIELPSRISKIGKGVFKNCINLQSAILPDSIFKIEESFFEGCKYLKTIRFPSNLHTIGKKAFFNCKSLRNLKLPNMLVFIDEYSFSGIKLKSLVIPSSVQNIRECAFEYARILEINNFSKIDIENHLKNIIVDVVYNNGFSSIFRNGDFEFFISDNNIKLIDYFGEDSNIITPEIVSYQSFSFDHYDVEFLYSIPKSIESIIFSNSVIKIHFLYGENNNKLKNIVLGKTTKDISIDFNSFPHLSNIEVNAENSNYYVKDQLLYSIHSKSLVYCLNSSKNLTISEKIDSIESGAFAFCNQLENIVLPSGIVSIGDYAFAYCCQLKNVNLPEEIILIGEFAFGECGQLNSINIPDSVVEIGQGAFSGCINLESIIIPNRIEIIKDLTFLQCERLSSVILPNNVQIIGSLAFCGCKSLTNIIIPKSTKEICNNAFSGCNKLSVVTNKSYLKLEYGSNSNGSVAYFAKHIFCNESDFKFATIDEKFYVICYSNKEHLVSIKPQSIIVIPEEIDEIDSISFNDLSEIKELIIPSNLAADNKSRYLKVEKLSSNISFFNLIDKRFLKTAEITSGLTINKNLFENCLNLQRVIIHNTINCIEKSAFMNCLSLTSIVIPESVKFIGQSAFAFCISLEEVILNSGIVDILEYTFYKCCNLKSMVLPDGVLSISDFAFYGCFSLENLVLPKSIEYVGKNVFDCCNLLNIAYKGSKRDWRKIDKVFDSLTKIKTLCNDGVYEEKDYLDELKCRQEFLNQKRVFDELLKEGNISISQYEIEIKKIKDSLLL